jgi:hypothetical protein
MIRALAILLTIALSGCASVPKTPVVVQPDKIGILTLNAENLFDTQDDPEKNDEAFLPKG